MTGFSEGARTVSAWPQENAIVTKVGNTQAMLATASAAGQSASCHAIMGVVLVQTRVLAKQDGAAGRARPELQWLSAKLALLAATATAACQNVFATVVGATTRKEPAL